MNLRRILLRGAGGLVAGGLSKIGNAQTSPGTAFIVSGFPAGGMGDFVARPLAEKMRGKYASNVLVEARTGAGGRKLDHQHRHHITLLCPPDLHQNALPIKFRDRKIEPSVKHLLLIRHSLPDEGHHTHPHDPPLKEEGHRHAENLAHRLKHEGIDRIVCSPQQRAIDTATPLVNLLGLPLEIIEGLAEVDRFAGHYRSGETLFAEGRWDEFIAAPARYMGRDPVEYRDTVLGAFSEVANDPRGSRVAVFSHGMTIKTILCAVLGLSDEAFALFSTGHCSVSRLSGNGFETVRSAKVTSEKPLRRMKVESINEALATKD